MGKVKVEETKSKESDTELRKTLKSLFNDFHNKNKSFSKHTSAENHELKSENAGFGEAKNYSKKKNNFSNEFKAESKMGSSSEKNVQNQKKNSERNFPRNRNKFAKEGNFATFPNKDFGKSKSHIIYTGKGDKHNKNFNNFNIMNKRRKFFSGDDNETITSSSQNFNKTNNSPSTKQDFPWKENKSTKKKNSFSVGNKNFIKYGTHQVFDENDNSNNTTKSKNSLVKSIEKHNIKSVDNKNFMYGNPQIYGENADNSSNISKSKNNFVKGNRKHNVKHYSGKEDNVNKSFNNSSLPHKNKKRKFSLIDNSNTDNNNTEKCDETNIKDSNQGRNNSPADFPRKKRKTMKYTSANSFNDGSFLKSKIDTESPHKISNNSFPSKTSPKEGNKFYTNVLNAKSEEKKNIFPTDFPRNKKNANVSFSEKFVQPIVHKIDENNESDADDVQIEPNKFKKEKNCSLDNNSSLDVLPILRNKKESESKHLPEWKLKREKELQCTLFVGNLPLSTTKKDLKKIFSPFGLVTLIRFAKGEHDGQKNWKMPNALNYAAESLPGFVTFEQEQHASDALSLNGTVFKDHHITVNLAVSAGSKMLYDSKQSIFIGNLPFDVQDDNIWDAFSKCGKIQGVRLVRDKGTGIGKGFGYVQFHTVEARDSALALDNLIIQGRTIRIKPVTSDKKQQKKLDPKFKRRDPFRSKAIKLKKSNPNTSSRKSIKKLMKREKVAHKKKKIAAIMRKAMK